MKPKKESKPKTSEALVRGGSPTQAARITAEIRDLIEVARNQVSATANLAMVNLSWNIGRVITQDVQENEKRAEYGTDLLARLASILTREYGRGFSRINLQDMRRFYERFQTHQTPSDLSGGQGKKDQTASNESRIPRPTAAESGERLLIDFGKHFRLGWSHYRLLLGQGDLLRPRFYFEQAAACRWPVRE